MEHDIEKNIRAKVLEVEQQPVQWRKDEVWKKLMEKKEPSGLRVLWLSAAACISVILLFTGYLYQKSVVEDTNRKLAELEKAYASQSSVQKNLRDQPLQEENCSEPIIIAEKVATHNVKRKRKMKITTTPPYDSTQHNQEVKQPEIVLRDTTTFHNSITTESAIQPIIGVVASDEKIARVEKRRKIKIISTQPFYDSKNRRATPVLARIK